MHEGSGRDNLHLDLDAFRMSTVTVSKHNRGVNRSAAKFEIEDGEYRELKNLRPSEEALEVRPGRIKHLTTIDPNKPGTGLVRFYYDPNAVVTGQGARNPNVAGNNATFGSIPWSTPDSAKVEDGSSATAANAAPFASVQTTQYLEVKEFSALLPADAVIKGIYVEVKCKAVPSGGAGGKVQDARVRLMKAGVVQVTDKAVLTDWSSSLIYRAYGGPTDLWGTTWTAAEMNASGFGAVVAANVTPGSTGVTPDEKVYYATTAHIDHIRVTIYFDTVTVVGVPGKETLMPVDASLYSDRSGAWLNINIFSLTAEKNMEFLAWKGVLYIQTGVDGPYKYTGVTGVMSLWDNGGDAAKTAPPRAKYMLLDQERIYLTGLTASGEESAVRICTLDDANDFPLIALPTQDNRGMVLYAGKNDGDYISGFAKLGTEKFIFKRRRVFWLTGTDSDSWALKPIFQVGSIAHRVIQDCGGALVWTDGRRIYKFDGQNLDPDFGKKVEEFLGATALEDWPNRCAVYWDGLYILWYHVSKAIVYDFRSQGWYGPWENIPARAVVVDRDQELAWIASGVSGDVWRLTGTTDDGLAIPWKAEGKMYDHDSPNQVKRARSMYVIGDGGVGTVTATLEAAGAPKQTALRTMTRSLVFSGTAIQTLATPLRLDGAHIGLTLEGVGAGGKIYETGIRADVLRRL